MLNKEIKKYLLGLSGCDGGDLGSPENPSIWVCGIEWGGGHKADELKKKIAMFDEKKSIEGVDDYKVFFNISSFNHGMLKILAVIHQNYGKVNIYKSFTKEIQPFVIGTKGYFKMNLYPIAFKNTNNNLWIKEFTNILGFETKKDYQKWCKENRFPKLYERLKKHKPKLVICFGKTYLKDFKLAFLGNVNIEMHEEIIENKKIYYKYNTETKTLITILPFPIGRYGLNSNLSIQKVGERIKQLLSNPPQ